MNTRLLIAVVTLHVSALSAQTPLAVPVLSRDATGTVTIKGEGVIRYSLDGSDPVARSGAYLAPIVLPGGGVVKARAFRADRKEKSALAEAMEPALRRLLGDAGQ